MHRNVYIQKKGCVGKERERQLDRQMDRKSMREIEKGYQNQTTNLKSRQDCLKLNFLPSRLNKKSIKANCQ